MNTFLNSSIPDLLLAKFFVALIIFLNIGNAFAQPDFLVKDTLYVNDDALLKDKLFPMEPVAGVLQNESGMRAGLLFDYESRKIVWEKDMHYAYPIASITKMMVALLTVESVMACNAEWTDEITMTRVLVKRVKRKKVRYTVSENYTLDALLHLAMISSHNEACNIIAKHLGGSVENFVVRMNQRARELQMNNTFFSNPSGLPAGKAQLDNSSSPSDLLLLSLECLNYPEILNITKIGYGEVSSDRASGIYRNHNRLVIEYENEVDGIKTGYTKNARFCLAATSNKNNHRLVGILLGCRNTWERNALMENMMSNYYQHIGIGRLGKSWEETLAMQKEKESKLSRDSSDQVASGNPQGEEKIIYKTVWKTERRTHHVKGGETLGSIASKYNTSVKQLRRWNRISGSVIYKGQKLAVYVNVKKKIMVLEEMIENSPSEEDSMENSGQKVMNNPELEIIPNQQEVKISEGANYIFHTVQSGDTLWKISKKYDGISVDEIKKINNITDSKSLKVGTRLKIIING